MADLPRREAALPKEVENLAAGVGEARPAEPPHLSGKTISDIGLGE